ncbi:DUF1569 domain-containing protein [Flavobacteriaceae bacterium M23B6Z8]
MKTVFDKSIADSLVERIAQLNENSSRQWGKMSPSQMVRHCILSEEMYQGTTAYKRLFIGRLFGKMALKSTLKDENPLKKNEPTHPTFKIKGEGDLTAEKEAWAGLIKQYNSLNGTTFDNFVHPFFGAMNKDQIGHMVYKHTDHHLRQFGV